MQFIIGSLDLSKDVISAEILQQYGYAVRLENDSPAFPFLTTLVRNGGGGIAAADWKELVPNVYLNASEFCVMGYGYMLEYKGGSALIKGPKYGGYFELLFIQNDFCISLRIYRL